MRLAIGLAAALALAAAPAPAKEGRKHALLIGIGDYLYDVPDLEGPPHDVAALKSQLIQNWQFAAENVKVLADGEATRSKILAAFDDLATRTRAGDYVLVYFSGHGTSSYEREDLGLDNNTGAVVPADFKLTAPDPSRSLLVGNRDLRPRLEKIDRDREVLVIFDSCYSGAAVRSLRALGQPRYVQLPRPATRSLSGFPNEDEGEFGSQTEKALPFPYRNLVYISAASKSEAARDITRAEIVRGQLKTVDGQPHGALTNFLIQGLSGAADSNSDRAVSYAELYSFVRDRVSDTFPHQPQLLAPDGKRDTLLAKSVLAGAPPAGASAAASKVPPSSLRVRLEGVAGGLARKIRGLKDVAVVEDGSHDVLVVQEAAGFKVHHASGDVLASFGPKEADAVAARLQKQVAVRALVDLRFDDQDFNVSIALPGNRGFLRNGDAFSIESVAESDSVFLVLSVDTGGHVSVLYPFSEGELSPRRSVRIPPEPDALKVSPPFGTEYVKVFAFRQRPAGIEGWMKAGFDATDPKLAKLLEWLRRTGAGRATDRLKVVTLESGS